MFEMIFENKNGKQLRFGPGTPFTIKEFTGLNPPKATINTNETALLDGATFNSSKLQMRSINIAFAIERDAEASRLKCYEVIQNKLPIRIYYKSELLDVFIDGYVEDFDFSYFTKKIIATLSVLCPSPFLKGAQEVVNELTAITNMFHFPFHSTTEPMLIMGKIDTLTSIEVENKGNVETGLTFELYARKPLKNPKIYNYKTGEFLEVNIEMDTGDLIIITTGQGNKTIKLLRSAVYTNIFNYLGKNSTWLQLDVNGSVFVYEVGEGNPADLIITIKHYDLFEGV